LIPDFNPGHCPDMTESPKGKRADDGVDGIFDQLRSLAELGKRIAVEAEQLEARMRALEWQDGGSRFARGTGVLPRHPVDEEMYSRVRKMLEGDPMRFAQIVEATGLTENKVKVLITKMQREGVKIVNLGAKNKALWYIPPPKVRERLERPSKEG
jgi:hypothetical protein